MKESEIERILVNEVKKLGGRAYKWTSPGNAGVPDRIVILPNRCPVFVELKAQGGKLTTLQEVQINRLGDLGQSVWVAKGVEGLCWLFKAMGYADAAKGIWKKYGVKGADLDGI